MPTVKFCCGRNWGPQKVVITGAHRGASLTFAPVPCHVRPFSTRAVPAGPSAATGFNVSVLIRVRLPPDEMAPWHQPRTTVFGGEVAEHPQDVSDDSGGDHRGRSGFIHVEAATIAVAIRSFDRSTQPTKTTIAIGRGISLPQSS